MNDQATELRRASVPALRAGGTVLAIIPQTLEDAFRIAKAAVSSGLTHRDMATPERALMVIMHGMEIGLPPMASLERIAIINGRRCVWGDAVPALAMDTGELIEWDEGFSGEGDSLEAYCRVARKTRNGVTFRKEATFSVAEAKKADLWDDRTKVKRKGRDGGFYEADNDSPWYRYQKRMLQMRARVAFRDLFSDKFMGLHIAEELVGRNGDAEMRDVTPSAQPIIHNPLQDDADLTERPPRDVREDLRAPAGMVVLGDEDAARALTDPEPDDGAVVHADGSVTRPTGKEEPDIDSETGEVFDAKVDSERRDAEDPPEPAPAAKPPRQARRKAQDEPKPAEAAKLAPDDKAAPAPNPALGVVLEQPWAKKTPADYIAYLWAWTEMWAKWGKDPNGLRDRFMAERDIRNNLGIKMEEKQLAECKAIAAGAFSRLGGVLK